ncbi:MAG TPA: hypothetical protein VGD27_14915, partial [Longimicrobiales bacterium]
MNEQRELLDKQVDRRSALAVLIGGLAAGMQAAGACAPVSAASEEDDEEKVLEWREYIKRHYRYMTEEERQATIERLER